MGDGKDSAGRLGDLVLLWVSGRIRVLSEWLHMVGDWGGMLENSNTETLGSGWA